MSFSALEVLPPVEIKSQFISNFEGPVCPHWNQGCWLLRQICNSLSLPCHSLYNHRNTVKTGGKRYDQGKIAI